LVDHDRYFVVSTLSRLTRSTYLTVLACTPFTAILPVLELRHTRRFRGAKHEGFTRVV